MPLESRYAEAARYVTAAAAGDAAMLQAMTMSARRRGRVKR